MKLMFIEVRGKRKTWLFRFHGNPQYLQEWRDDGLEVNIIENMIPEWVAELGMARAWCFLQDCMNFKNPFRKGAAPGGDDE